uniref:Ribosome assembly protein rrb1 n=1 Tax=Lygus hesperus TaxID=30085 RepID=A0A0A9XGT6_LYGHE
MMLVCGTQADELNKNELVVLYVSNICRTKHDVESDDDSEDSYIGDDGGSDADSTHEDDNDDGVDQKNVNDGEPIIHHRTISHYGTANRVRCCPFIANKAATAMSNANSSGVGSNSNA